MSRWEAYLAAEADPVADLPAEPYPEPDPLPVVRAEDAPPAEPQPPPADPAAVYDSLRAQALAATPDSVGIKPGVILPSQVFAVVMEFTSSGEDRTEATLFCTLEGDRAEYVHVGFYTSSGFCVIGETFPQAVLDAARALIRTVDDYRLRMLPAVGFPRPRPKWTRFYAFNPQGPLTIEIPFDEDDLVLLSNAGHAVVRELKTVVEAAAANPPPDPA